MKRKIVPLFFPFAGCTARCSYCNQWGVVGEGLAVPTPQEVEQSVRRAREEQVASGDKRPLEVGFYGGTFTGMIPELQEEMLSVASRLLEEGVLHSIRVSTHPSHVTPESLALLSEHHVETVELGIQSFSQAPLELAGRGYTPEQAREACASVRDAGIDLVVQLMAFLPGASEQDDQESASIAASLDPAGVRIFPTLVLSGTGLERTWQDGLYTPASVPETVDRVASMLDVFCQTEIDVLRIGLQDSVTLRTSYKAGPVHPALGELCWAELLARVLARSLPKPKQDDRPPPPDRLTKSRIRVRRQPPALVSIAPSLTSLLYGHENAGLNRLADLFGQESFNVLVEKEPAGVLPSRPEPLYLAPGRFLLRSSSRGIRVEKHTD